MDRNFGSVDVLRCSAHLNSNELASIVGDSSEPALMPVLGRHGGISRAEYANRCRLAFLTCASSYSAQDPNVVRPEILTAVSELSFCRGLPTCWSRSLAEYKVIVVVAAFIGELSEVHVSSRGMASLRGVVAGVGTIRPEFSVLEII